jgi:ATP:corrinoid adenosyltransferase
VKEMTNEEREKIGAELEELHGEAIRVFSGEVYEKEPAAIGLALTYLDCGCVLLCGFDKSADITGEPGIVESADSCTVDHVKTLEDGFQAGAYNTILWKDNPEEFDRKYGNEERIIIASKLFPLQEEE